MVPLMNYSNDVYTVSQNERVAQLVTITTGSISFEKVEELDISDRSTGGFGSTNNLVRNEGVDYLQNSVEVEPEPEVSL